MPINVDDFANADSAFREQIKTEMQRATENLNRIATLFQAGLAHPQVLKEFRESVDRVREAGWIAQQGLDSAQSPQTTAEMCSRTVPGRPHRFSSTFASSSNA
jgi:hypothetical protein